MRIGWLTCIPAVLLPHSLCRSTTANAPANRQMPIASVVSGNSRNEKTFLLYWDKIFDELTASVTSSLEFETSQFVQFSPFDLRTIHRRFLWKKRQENDL